MTHFILVAVLLQNFTKELRINCLKRSSNDCLKRFIVISRKLHERCAPCSFWYPILKSDNSQESREGYFVALRRKETPTKEEVFAE